MLIRKVFLFGATVTLAASAAVAGESVEIQLRPFEVTERGISQ